MAAMSWYCKENLKLALFCLFMSNFATAFSDVCVDSLMVIQSRRYPEKGADELNSFSWTCLALGGLVGSLLAAVLTEKYDPSYCFIYSSFMGFALAFVATRLNVSVEKDGLEPESGEPECILHTV